MTAGTASRLTDGPGWLTLDQVREALDTGTGKGVRIAVIDSGVEVSHRALAGLQLVDDVVIRSMETHMEAEPGEGKDAFGHGTAIASIIRAGAPEAEIGSFRVLDSRLGSRTAIIRHGVRLALDRGYHILNCSFACEGRDQRWILQYKDWVDEAYVHGVHVVAACNNQNYLRPEWPGHFSSCITVNMARTQDPGLFCRKDNIVAFAARGEELEVPWREGGQRKVTGSSYAAPAVSAMVARLLSVHPGLSAPMVKAALMSIARPWVRELAAGNIIDP